MNFPKMGLIRQIFESSDAPNAGQCVHAEFQRTGLLKAVKKNQKVLITAGSRGIESMVDILRACVEAVKQAGGDPFIFPAMGSHGRGEPQGQVEVLRHLGISPSSVGAPIYEEMAMSELGSVGEDCAIYVDKAAIDADHILLINRIKDHTEYIGETESGLLKLAVVGLGRQPGAENMHRLAVNVTYQNAIHAMAQLLFEKLNVLGGIAILEDHFNRLRRIEVVSVADIIEREAALLEEAKKFKPKLPFDELDVLLVDEIGKEISGAGMDTKVIGRIMNVYEKECEKPEITRIIVRDLSKSTYGNAVGIGLADYTTRKAVDKIDFKALNLNCITASAPEKGKIPIALPTDRDALEAAFQTIGMWTPGKVKMAWISNTADLEWLAVSSALVEQVQRRQDIQIAEGWLDLPFDSEQNLPKLKKFLKDRGILERMI
jgi:hypothetical protein